jgi:hypothetical protein
MEQFFKNSIISTIIMMADKVYSHNHVQSFYSYDRLNQCSYSNLEGIRDRLISEYNDKLTNKTK